MDEQDKQINGQIKTSHHKWHKIEKSAIPLLGKYQ